MKNNLTVNEQVVLAAILRLQENRDKPWSYRDLQRQLELNGTPKKPNTIARSVTRIREKGHPGEINTTGWGTYEGEFR